MYSCMKFILKRTCCIYKTPVFLRPVHAKPEEFENGGFMLKAHQSLVILDLCLKETRSGKSHDYRDAIIFKRLLFQNVSVHKNKKPAFSNSSGLKIAFEKLDQYHGEKALA